VVMIYLLMVVYYRIASDKRELFLVKYADLILKNADVVTIDPIQPSASMVAVKGDRILMIGDEGEAEGLRGVRTRVIDCGGNCVVPGFNDAHCHVFSLVRKLLGVDVSPAAVRSIAEIKKLIREKAQNTPSGRWLSGTGYNEFYLTEKRHPWRGELDEAAPHHPVVLVHRSLHACVLNSLALSLAGINRETEEPPGCLIERDPATGEPNGVLFEMLAYLRKQVMPPLAGAEIENGIQLANRHYLSLGITSLQEATVTNDLAQWTVFQGIKEKGVLKSRLTMMFGSGALPQFQEAGLSRGSGDSQLRLGAVKIVISQATGSIEPAPRDLNEMVLRAQRGGFPVAIHAVEESSVAAAVTALEYARRQTPDGDRRHRIEHCSECTARLAERLKALHAVVVTQPPFIYYSGERYLATVPAPQRYYLYPLRSLMDSGLVVAGSSDSPVVPENPLVGICAAITRRAESGEAVLPGERIAAAQALAMYTTGAAYADFQEEDKGKLAPGMLADLVVLSGNPLKVPPEMVKDLRVAMTVIGGKVVWEGG